MTALDADAAREAWSAPHFRGLVTRLAELHPSEPLHRVEAAAKRALFVDDSETEIARLRDQVRALREEVRICRLERDNAVLRHERLGEMYVDDLVHALRTGTVGPT